MDPRLLRHLSQCNNADLPGSRRRLYLDGHPVGYVAPDLLAGAPAAPDGGVAADRAMLADEAQRLLTAGRYRRRGEAFDVRDDSTDEVVATLDRGVLPLFGIRAVGVHLNGLVRAPEGTRLWVARRAASKALDPGKLDHVAAGGVPAGLSPAATLVKEAAEEAAIPEELARRAVQVATISYAMERPEGLRRDRIHCYDLELPADFVPRAADGEVEGFFLWPLGRAAEAVRDGDAFKFNVNLVLIDLFLRSGLIRGEAALALRAALDAGTA
jgi:8-oxo-dGTP pyrophosphatase MutT (NUDIX family)